MEQDLFVKVTSHSARFREWHIIQILQNFDVTRGPFDLFLSNYFRHNPSLGSKDRAEIGQKVYLAIRWQSLLQVIAKRKGVEGWAEIVPLLAEFNPREYVDAEDIDLYDRVSFPKVLFDLIEKAYGHEKAIEIALNSNEEAPVTLRANPLKCTRDELIAILKEKGIEGSPTLESPYGIVLQKRAQLFQLPEFEKGYFEMQDEGSQLIADLLQAKPGNAILDYCAGSGGKTLAFAHKVQGKGQIYLHDIRKEALLSARQRLKRAGIQNVQSFFHDDDQKKRILKGRIDWIFVDAPCTGTGALRRNPDMKSRFTNEFLQTQLDLQRLVFKEALTYLKPKGSIVYATCSILPQENEEQVEFFCKTYGLQVVGEPFKSFPTTGKMDGFYAIVLKKLPAPAQSSV